MPVETGYARQVGVRAAEAMPLTSAASYGAELGAKIEQVGQQLDQQNLQAYKVQRQHTAAEEWAGVVRGHVGVRGQMDAVQRDLRADGGAGHAERIAAAYETYRPALLDGITDPGVRRRAEAMFDDYGSTIGRREGEWEEVRRVENVLTDFSETVQISRNRIARLENHDDYLIEQELRAAEIAGLEIDEALKPELLKQEETADALAYMRGQVQRDPVLARDMLAGGLFDDVLDADQQAALTNASETEIRALEVAAHRDAAEQRAATIAQIRADIARQVNGVPLDDEAWAEREAAVAEFGDPGLLESVQDARATAGFDRAYRGADPMPPAVIEGRLAELAGKGNQRSDLESRELAYLEDILPGVTSAFESDTAGFLMQSGGAPVIDWNEAGSLANRQAWAETQREAYGRTVAPISDAEAAPMRDLYRQGRKIDVLAALDGFTDPFARVDAAQVIAPTDRLFQHLAAMPARLRQSVTSGTAAMDANPDLMKLDELAEAGPVQWQLRGQLMLSLKNMEVEDAEAIWQSALALTADALRNNGATLQMVDEDRAARMFRNNITAALGGEVRRSADGRQVQYGGLGTYQGGHAFMLADNLSAEQFIARVNADVARQRTAGTGPVNPNGTPALLNAPGVRPVWQGGSFYHWETARGDVLKDAAGNPFVSSVARSGRRGGR